jgi:hypothetical protein
VKARIARLTAGLVCAVFAATALAPAEAAPASIKRQQCRDFYDGRYAKERAPKAFALSADGMRCGAAWGHLSKDISRKQALGYCSAQAKKHNAGKCKVIDTR